MAFTNSVLMLLFDKSITLKQYAKKPVLISNANTYILVRVLRYERMQMLTQNIFVPTSVQFGQIFDYLESSPCARFSL